MQLASLFYVAQRIQCLGQQVLFDDLLADRKEEIVPAVGKVMEHISHESSDTVPSTALRN